MWKCSPFYFLEFLDTNIVSDKLQEDYKVFQKALESKRIVIMIFLIYIISLAYTNLSYMNFYNFSYILLVCKTFLEIFFT